MASKSSSTWALRVDDYPGLVEKIHSWKVEKVLVVLEDPDDDCPNPHYHMAIRLPKSCTQQSFRDKVLAALKGEAKLDYATKIWDDGSEYLQYCCKGDDWLAVKAGDKIPGKFVPRLPKVIAYTPKLDTSGGIESPDIWHSRWWEQAVKDYSPELRKKRKENLPALIEGWASQIKSEFSTGELVNYIQQQDRAMELVAIHYKLKIQDHHAFSIIQSIMYHVDSKQSTEDFKSRMFKRFSKS